MTTPPVGWTKDTSYNDYALRVTTGAASAQAFGFAFSTIFKNYTNLVCTGPTQTAIGSTTLDNTRIPVHRHGAFTHPGATVVRQGAGNTFSVTTPQPATTSSVGGTAGHTHPVGTVEVGLNSPITQAGTPASINLNVKYVDTIIVTRN